MKLHDLKPNKGATKSRKKVGRGNGSGLGTYSGRGMNGQNCRTGGGVRPGFEGGQTPLILRMPKLKGFKNINRVNYQVVNVAKLANFKAGSEITAKELLAKGYISKANQPVKILGEGELKHKLTVNVSKVSKVAREKIEKAGGKVI